MTTDANGRFRIENVAAGSYRLTFSSVGYQTKQMDLKELSHDMDLGNIELDSVSVMLKEVVVKSARVIRARHAGGFAYTFSDKVFYKRTGTTEGDAVEPVECGHHEQQNHHVGTRRSAVAHQRGESGHPSSSFVATR